MTVAVLFARADSIYKTLPGTDVWDMERDARKWPGGTRVIAHPPCRAWGRLQHFAKPRDDERELGLFAMQAVRKHGGVVEHPAFSELFVYHGCSPPGQPDEFGGWLLPIWQSWWGHRADKATWLYIAGIHPDDVPIMPMQLGNSTHVVSPAAGKRKGSPGWRPLIRKDEREATPIDLAKWLLELAQQ